MIQPATAPRGGAARGAGISRFPRSLPLFALIFHLLSPANSRGALVSSTDSAAGSSDTARNVVIVVIDGARLAETFDLGPVHIPRIWNDLRPRGTLFTNFRNDGPTITNPGHAAFLTGHYDRIKNDGSERPHFPTLFELHRVRTGDGDTCCAAVTGKPKLHILTHSTHDLFGEKFEGRWSSPETMTDTATWRLLREVMDSVRPRILIVNFPSVDVMGHDSSWGGYLGALRTADSLVHLLWMKIQSDPFYRDRTSMFVSSDHGRHDDAHGGFQHHGCACEGCRRIMGFGIGPGFRPGAVVADPVGQVDVFAAAARLLSLPVPPGEWKPILTADP